MLAILRNSIRKKYTLEMSVVVAQPAAVCANRLARGYQTWVKSTRNNVDSLELVYRKYI